MLKDLIDSPVIYLSNYIIKNKKDYYRLLQEVQTNNNWEEWIIYILKAVEETSKRTLEIIKKVKRIIDETTEKAKNEIPKIYSKELIDLLFHQPYIKISILEKNLNVERHTCAKYLKELEKIGILSSQKVGNEVVYVNIKLVDALKG